MTTEKIALLICFLSTATSFAAGRHALLKNDFTTWPNAKVDAFGCFLENSFEVKGAKFNCDTKGYVNKGDPCKNKAEYYEGPKFPADKVGQVSQQISKIKLKWEHGRLQSVTVDLKDKSGEKDLRSAFSLPATAEIQDMGKHSRIILTAFEHRGAEQVGCDKGDAGAKADTAVKTDKK